MAAADAGACEGAIKKDLRFFACKYRRNATATKMAEAATAVHAAARSAVESVDRPLLEPAAAPGVPDMLVRRALLARSRVAVTYDELMLSLSETGLQSEILWSKEVASRVLWQW